MAHPSSPRAIACVAVASCLVVLSTLRTASADETDSSAAVVAATSPASDEAGEPALRLLVLVVIDQFRGDSLRRYEPLFGEGGFRRLCEGGVWFQNAHFTHAHTVTAPGHATIGTGAGPSVHGIIGNDWIDRASGSSVGCVADSSHPVLGTASETGNGSPHRLRASTFADEWIFATAGRARAFGVSGKDRGAILPVGRSGKAFWYSTASGRMVTSRYYYSDLPDWAREHGESKPAEAWSGRAWERATSDDDGVPSARDDRSFETDPSGLGKTFPHTLDGRRADDPSDGSEGADGGAGRARGRAGRGGFGRAARPQGRLHEQLPYTPFADELVLGFALTLLDAEELGRRDTLDIVSISLSSNDIVGHAYGPDSVEAKEMAWQLDRRIAQLLDALDERFGDQGYLIALTADHGVAYSPEAVTAEGFDAHRLDTDEMLRKIRRKLNFGVRYLDWTAGTGASGFYFDPDALIHGGPPPEELESIARGIIREAPGIATAYTRSEILGAGLPDSEETRSLRSAYHADRSPDVVWVLEPYWIPGTTTASHGTLHRYDTHVPLVFYGAGVEPRRVTRFVDMRDLAPTLTAILGCTPPSGAEGEPLREMAEGSIPQPFRR